ncbi:MAG: CAP domain-containing protein, partial [Draconibacterium sp.]|nr:CAP domain-containing protein [Draconibacterium sp.]
IKVTLVFIIAFQLLSCGYAKNSKNNGNEGNISLLNTAANAGYLSSLEKEIIYEINLMRSNPAKYAIDHIAPLANNYRSKMLYYPGDDPLKTKEGVRALNECVRVLKRTKPLPIIYPSKGLSKAASDHVKDQSRTGRTGHLGRDRSNVKQRIERYGDWNIRIGENIAYGGFSARQIVIYLLIDDGIRDRGHRKTFLHPDYRKIGLATGTHPKYKSMCVMDFAGEFTEN